MKGFQGIKQVYFLGIGGIGMSALARYFKHGGKKVAGYDRTPTRLTGELGEEAIGVHYQDLGPEVGNHVGPPGETLVVVTPALPSDFGEWLWFREKGYPILKRSEVLGLICKAHKCIAIAGTHGKTTISAMTATILKGGTIGCGAFLGGIAKNFNSNLLLPAAGDAWMVAEADEYDRSFLQLFPDVALITYTDPDHLDIYSDHASVKESYRQFAGQVRPGGALIVRKELEKEFSIPGIRYYTYSLGEEADFCCRELETDPVSGCYHFRIQTPWELSDPIHMVYPGILNVQNGLAAAAAARIAGAPASDIKRGLEAFTGVRRRFDILFRNAQTIYIDDYAHHPEELKSFIASVRLFLPGKKITGIFQPHLYTRTRDFSTAFAASLDLLDEAILLPVYPARELPIEGVSSELILRQMTIDNRRCAEKKEAIALLARKMPEVVVTMGAGDIDLLSEEIIEVLKNETDRL